jgi:hypothetical protein
MMPKRWNVSEHTSMHVPRVFATYGPIDRDKEPSSFDTYIFMEYLEGQSLNKSWNNLDDKAKSTIMDELKGYLSQLRAIPSSSYIGSLNRGPVMDTILEYDSAKGTELKPILMKIITNIPISPLASEDDFNNTLIDAYCSHYNGEVRPFMSGMLSSHKQRSTLHMPIYALQTSSSRMVI